MLLKAKSDFVPVQSRKEVAQTPANKVVRFAFCKELLAYCQENGITYAVEVTDIPQALFANHFQASYLIASKSLAPKIQKLADNYLFDTKVLVEIRFEWELEVLAQQGIDGAILPQPL